MIRSYRSAWTIVWGLILALVAVIAPRRAMGEQAAEPKTPDGYQVGPMGHRFRVRFDPASRVALGSSAALVQNHQGSIAVSAEMHLDLSYRSMFEFGDDKEKIVWQVDQRFIPSRVVPMHRDALGIPSFDATLYELWAHRHDSSPRVVLPMSPPIAVPFPFDIGLAAEVGKVQAPSAVIALPYPTSRRTSSLLRVGVVHTAFFLDPWRSGAPGRSVEIGVGARYDFDLLANPTFGSARFIHRVAPMTAGSLRLRYQSSDGLSVLDVRGEAVPHWTSEAAWRLMASSMVRFERTLLAINDEPIAAVVEGAYRLSPPSHGVETAHEVRAGVGLSVQWQLR